MTYKVVIQETLSKTILVEAENKDEAYTRAQEAYSEGEVNLDYEDMLDNTIEVDGKVDPKDKAELYEFYTHI